MVNTKLEIWLNNLEKLKSFREVYVSGGRKILLKEEKMMFTKSLKQKDHRLWTWRKNALGHYRSNFLDPRRRQALEESGLLEVAEVVEVVEEMAQVVEFVDVLREEEEEEEESAVKDFESPLPVIRSIRSIRSIRFEFVVFVAWVVLLSLNLLFNPITRTLRVVDPALLAAAKIEMQIQRRKEHELRRLQLATTHFQNDSDKVESSITKWTRTAPELSNFFSASSTGYAIPVLNSERELYKKFETLHLATLKKHDSLSKWEEVLSIAEKAMDDLIAGTTTESLVNDAIEMLSQSSQMEVGKLIDISDIFSPGEACSGRDYIAYDGANNILDMDDAPVKYEDALVAFQNLKQSAESTVDTVLRNADSESSSFHLWVEDLFREELQKLGIVEEPDTFKPLDENTPYPPSNVYSAGDGISDIDSLVEIELAHLTGCEDLASILRGGRVLHHGPYTTSPSLYETLPLLNRILAYFNLRFYGHSPHVALIPTSIHGRGQCWSVTKEKGRRNEDDLRGEFATLSLRLARAITVTEVVIEHLLGEGRIKSSAPKSFRILGFEDGGAFGQPWDLGTFQYDVEGKFGLQTFSITQTPVEMKAISLAIDSNWGADYMCLYRFRVHGLL